mmetsp:Transcript_8055/g.12342  ORF Transcript_8055/g.12342 Transcript_8055/m.12342 type:complete len:219 (+) Transcript_8055:85-741(+)
MIQNLELTTGDLPHINGNDHYISLNVPTKSSWDCAARRTHTARRHLQLLQVAEKHHTHLGLTPRKWGWGWGQGVGERLEGQHPTCPGLVVPSKNLLHPAIRHVWIQPHRSHSLGKGNGDVVQVVVDEQCRGSCYMDGHGLRKFIHGRCHVSLFPIPGPVIGGLPPSIFPTNGYLARHFFSKSCIKYVPDVLHTWREGHYCNGDFIFNCLGDEQAEERS